MSEYTMCSCEWEEADCWIYNPQERLAEAPAQCDECYGSIGQGEPCQTADLMEYDEERDDHVKVRTMYTCAPCLAGPVAFVLKNCGCRIWGADWLMDHLTTVFYEYDFQHPGVKFRVGRFIIGMRRRAQARVDAAS